MTRILLLLALAVAFMECKRDQDPEPAPEIAGIVGGWHMVEMQYKSGDSTIVKNMANEEQRAFSIRFDGVMLYDGVGACCASGKYVINGKPFEVKPAEDVPYNDDCALVDCIACPQLIITQSGDEMTIETCLGIIRKYVRKK